MDVYGTHPITAYRLEAHSALRADGRTGWSSSKWIILLVLFSMRSVASKWTCYQTSHSLLPINKCILMSDFVCSDQFRPVIGRAMREIEARTCIRFRERQNERDYVYLVNGKGCHSKVGRTGGRQLLSLGNGCHDVGSTLHELCHAIGLYHEHMRYDRDQYLQIEWSNIMPSMYDQFQKVPVYQYRPATNFDYNSIMIYGSRAFTKNGQNTMIPRDARARLMESHFKQTLARSDVININSLYGCQ